MRRSVLLAATLLVACGGPAPAPGPSPSAPPAAATRKPNVVLMLIDTLRADALPFYGYPRDTAPFLGELAAKGVVFERAYSTSGWTVPATASLFTSLYPTQHGMTENLGRKEMRTAGVQEKEVAALPSAVKTLPEILKEAGYRTFGASDNFHVGTLRGFHRGFDRFAHANNKGAANTNQRVLEWKEEIRGASPWFLYVHYMDPHNPYLSHDPWVQEYREDGRAPSAQPHRRTAYDSEIRFLHDHIRHLATQLAWDDDTIVIVTADHGEEFGEHGGSGHASSLYRELLEVPLLVWSRSGRFAPRRAAEPVGLVDVLPTLRELAGLPADRNAQGVSFLPILETGRGGDRRRTFFAHIQTFGRKRGTRTIEGVLRERWKWVRDEVNGVELYDMSTDRGETRNLADAESGVATDLAATWRRFAETAPRYEGTKKTFQLDRETEEELRALGYVQ